MTIPTPKLHAVSADAKSEAAVNDSNTGASDNVPAVSPNPFDISTLRLGQNFLETAGVRKLLTTVPLRKPNRQTFIRVHPDPAYRGTFATLELKEENEFYIVSPELAEQLPDECSTTEIYTAITRQKVAFLWPPQLGKGEGKEKEGASAAPAHEQTARSKTTQIGAP